MTQTNTNAKNKTKLLIIGFFILVLFALSCLAGCSSQPRALTSEEQRICKEAELENAVLLLEEYQKDGHTVYLFLAKCVGVGKADSTPYPWALCTVAQDESGKYVWMAEVPWDPSDYLDKINQSEEDE